MKSDTVWFIFVIVLVIMNYSLLNNSLLNNQTEKLIFMNNLTVGDYNITFLDSCQTENHFPKDEKTENTTDCLGYTYEDGRIFILNNRTKEEIIETCNHEILHNIIDMDNRTREEEIVEEIDEYINIKECDFL